MSTNSQRRLPRRRRCFLPAGIALLLAAGLGAGPAGAGDWPMFAGGPTHVGVAAESLTPNLSPLWSTALGSSVDSSPAVVGGRVYVGTAEGELVCLEAASGAVLWRYRTAGAVVSSPAVVGGRVVFGSVDRFLYCLAADTGKPLWKYRTWEAVVGSPTVAGGVVYCGSMDGSFSALGLEQGELRWQAQEAAGVTCAPAVGNGLVAYGDRQGTVRVRRAETGVEVWSAPSTEHMVASPTIAGADLLFPFMSHSALVPPKLRALVVCDLATGPVRWAVEGQLSVFTTPAVADGVVYLATVEGYLSGTELRALKLADGTVLWKRAFPALATSSPVVAGDCLFLGAGDGAVYAVQRATGETAGKVALAKRIYSSPAVAGGRLFIGANDGKLYCLGPRA